jgi:hypothetical protein
MKFLKPFAMGTVIAACAMLAPPSFAHVAVGVSVGFAPPPRVERVAPWPGHAWVPGCWRWNGARHVWVAGYWNYPRLGYRYVPAHWVRTGPWRFRAGYGYR